jgi:hypothetical protein
MQPGSINHPRSISTNHRVRLDPAKIQHPVKAEANQLMHLGQPVFNAISVAGPTNEQIT